MKKITLALFSLSLLIATGSFAQETKSGSPSARGLSLSVGLEGALPVGTFGDFYNFGFGGSAKLAIPVASNFDATVSAGYIGFGKSKLTELDEKTTFTMIPFKGGIRYRTDAANGGFYVEPQVGITQVKVGDEGNADFTYALNLGYLINNKIDISTRYEAVSTEGVSTKMIGLRLAYNFSFARVK